MKIFNTEFVNLHIKVMQSTVLSALLAFLNAVTKYTFTHVPVYYKRTLYVWTIRFSHGRSSTCSWRSLPRVLVCCHRVDIAIQWKWRWDGSPVAKTTEWHLVLFSVLCLFSNGWKWRTFIKATLIKRAKFSSHITNCIYLEYCIWCKI